MTDGMPEDETSGWSPEDGAGYMPTEERTSNRIPEDDLRELLNKWRSGEFQNKHDYHAGLGLQIAADELEALLDE